MWMMQPDTWAAIMFRATVWLIANGPRTLAA